MNHDHITRPADCLNSWLEEYGYNKNRRAVDSSTVLAYALVRERGADGLWRNRWIMGGAANDPVEAFKELFAELVQLYKQCRDAELRENSVKVLCLLVMTYGEGRWAIGDPDDNDNAGWNNLSKEEQAHLRAQEPEFFAKFDLGTMPVRIVNAITSTGLVAEVSMFPPDHEPIVEVIEQWSESESGDEVETKGAIDEVLISTFAFLQLIEQSVADNEEPTVNGLLRTSLKMAQEGDTQMMSFLFRMMATGLDSGMFQLGDD